MRRFVEFKGEVPKGLFDNKETSLASVLEDQNYNALHRRVSSEVARAGITLVRNRGEMLPQFDSVPKVVVMALPGLGVSA